jgi:MFS family permease
MSASATGNAGLTTGHRRVIVASSVGTVFEWYDFYLYGSLAAVIAKQFFTALNPSSGFIFALLAFAAGFAVRPFGAIIFGRLGDLVGRKYTLLITIFIMGASTLFAAQPYSPTCACHCSKRSITSSPVARSATDA